MTRRKLPIIATIVVALAVAAMIALGVWQLQRRGEKLAELQVLAANPAKPPMAFPDPPVGSEELLFRRAAAFCLKPVGFDIEGAGKAGFRVIARCATGVEGPGFSVQLGTTEDPHFKSNWTGGKVSGTIAQLPSSTPLIGTLFRKRSAEPLMLVADTPAPGLKPNVMPTIDSIPNNHLAYAVQWFLFALIALIIYGLALRRRARKG